MAMLSDPVVLTMPKRGRQVVVGKLVLARPLNKVVLAMVFRKRRQVQHVSLPPAALAFARSQGAELWIVRLDPQGRCLSFDLAEVEHAGWLRPSDGQPEWFLPLAKFQPISWQDWPFITRTLEIQQPVATLPQQLTLF